MSTPGIALMKIGPVVPRRGMGRFVVWNRGRANDTLIEGGTADGQSVEI